MASVDKKSIFSNYFHYDTLLNYAKKAHIQIYAKYPSLGPNTRFCKRFHSQEGVRILDAGCGEGMQISILKKILPNASFSALDIARSPSLKDEEICDFHECNFDEDRMPYGDDTFDYVYSQHVIEHLHNPMNFIKECYRVLKTGGFLYIECPDVRWSLLPHLPFVTGKRGGFNFWDDPTHLRPWSRPSLSKATVMAGFTNPPNTFYVRKFAHILAFPFMFISRNDDFKVAFLHSFLGLWCGVIVEK
ncbi:MAG: class I SAM-dependent methyltransferase [Planctomycetaceae bacterium]|nr:class I SAM-dependent methyltransferase [Planctomycetaceae bacterium]